MILRDIVDFFHEARRLCREVPYYGKDILGKVVGINEKECTKLIEELVKQEILVERNNSYTLKELLENE